jgi:hypothetical protein
VTTERVWRLADMEGTALETSDVETITLQHEGETYIVAVVGPTGMTVRQMTQALRASIYYSSRCVGVDAGAELKIRPCAPGELTPPGKPS